MKGKDDCTYHLACEMLACKDWGASSEQSDHHSLLCSLLRGRRGRKREGFSEAGVRCLARDAIMLALFW